MQNRDRGGPGFRQQGFKKPFTGPARQAPDRGPQASPVRIENFQKLLHSSGSASNLAIILGLGLGRVQELSEGFGFSTETAFHIETELGLPSGWLDRPYASLPPNVSLERKRELSTDTNADQGFAASSEASIGNSTIQEVERDLAEVSSAQPANGTAGEASHSEPASMPTPASLPASTTASRTFQLSLVGTTNPAGQPAAAPVAPSLSFTPKAVGPAPLPRVESSPASELAHTLRQSSPQENVSTSMNPRIKEQPALLEVRRLNAHVLMDFPGGKTGVGKLIGKSPANISHILYGKKLFTAELAREFEAALNLPDGWFDSPRANIDVPKSLIDRAVKEVSGKGRAAPAKAVAKPTQVTASAGAVSPAESPIKRGRGRPVSSKSAALAASVGKQAALAPAAVAASAPVAPAASTGPAASAPTASKPFKPTPAGAGVTARAPSAAISPAQGAVASALQSAPGAAVAPMPRAQVVQAPLMPPDLAEMLGQAQSQPMAQSLARVILLLSRTGTLGEDKCVRLLQEVTLMATPT